MIYPRLSPSGASWCAEGLEPGDVHTVVIDGETVAYGGIQPAWLNEQELVYADTDEARVWRMDRGGLILDVWETGRPVNRLQAQDGHWCGWMPGYGYVLDGAAVQATQEPALGPGGALWMPPPSAIDPRWNEAGRAAVNHPSPPRITPQEWAPWEVTTHWCVPVMTPQGPWMLRLEDRRLVLHPLGDPIGYVVFNGDTYWPDARWFRDVVRIVWADGAGVIQSRWVGLDAPRVDLREAAVPPVPPLPPVEPTVPDYRQFSWDHCTIHRDADDIGAWPITSEPSFVVARDGEVEFQHSKAGAWPIVPYEDIVVEGCIWTIAPEGDHWRAATWDRLRPGQTTKTMTVGEYQQGYALGLPGWVPRNGDVIGYLVSTPARMDERGPRNERSRIAWVTFGADTGPIAVEGGPTVPTDPPPPVTPPTDLSPLWARVAALEAWARSFRGPS